MMLLKQHVDFNMTWLKISQESSAKEILSIEDGSRIGLEGWRVLQHLKSSSPGVLQSVHKFYNLSTGRWTSSRMKSSCKFHADCEPDECVHRTCEPGECIVADRDGTQEGFSPWLSCGPLWFQRNFIDPTSTCHSPEGLNENCVCGIHSFSSLEDLTSSLFYPRDPGLFVDETTNIHQPTKIAIPVRLAHAGKLFKGSIGVKSHIATLTGIQVPSTTSMSPKHEDMVLQTAQEAANNYKIPLLGLTAAQREKLGVTSTYEPTSAEVLNQNFGE